MAKEIDVARRGSSADTIEWEGKLLLVLRVRATPRDVVIWRDYVTDDAVEVAIFDVKNGRKWRQIAVLDSWDAARDFIVCRIREEVKLEFLRAVLNEWIKAGVSPFAFGCAIDPEAEQARVIKNKVGVWEPRELGPRDEFVESFRKFTRGAA